MSERQIEWRLGMVGVDGEGAEIRKSKRKERLLTREESEGRNLFEREERDR